MNSGLMDLLIILAFTLFLIIKEAVPAKGKENTGDSGHLILVLTFFRFVFYAIPFYVADITLVRFILSVLDGHPFIYTDSLFNSILRFGIVFGVFILAKMIYPRITSKYLPSMYSKLPESPGYTVFYRYFNRTMYEPFLLAVIYINILLAAVIPLGIYAILIQCPPDNSCWPF